MNSLTLEDILKNCLFNTPVAVSDWQETVDDWGLTFERYVLVYQGEARTAERELSKYLGHIVCRLEVHSVPVPVLAIYCCEEGKL